VESRALLRRQWACASASTLPLPSKHMVPIGLAAPLLGTSMKYYATTGTRTSSSHRGTGADAIKDYLPAGTRSVSTTACSPTLQESALLIATSTTGASPSSIPALASNIGHALKAVEPYLKGGLSGRLRDVSRNRACRPTSSICSWRAVTRSALSRRFSRPNTLSRRLGGRDLGQ